MAEPLPATNRCTKCGEWWAQAHMCPTAKQAYAYRGPLPDCRTCSHYDDTGPGADICYADICTNGDRYDPLPVVQLWKTK